MALGTKPADHRSLLTPLILNLSRFRGNRRGVGLRGRRGREVKRDRMPEG